MDGIFLVKARITVIPTSAGGRRTPIMPGYRPDHVFNYDKTGKILRAHMGDIQFSHRVSIPPGESDIITIRFMGTSEIQPYLIVGQKWWLHEGPMVVAEGEILDIATGVEMW